ncbi:putative ubiquitin carboxyl-terminal hydrolase [Tetraselmis virus 1]|uniref:Putative ubiquitin carboxyl-terminal hydrolase n=1 Tax=Tetraselmis virus 1 TaxID=2060617 RepID=A0A2P0VMK8_9VIRU|nr:putative ubiquitin carboxyl-terminal hydrolase [Tetraselmis virus 1]AUF82127.1 putative ubiquitin carboxyl-terminal hydrolase [Tetraselmis virus 1]
MRNLGNTCFAAAVIWALKPCKSVNAVVSVEKTQIHKMLKALFDNPKDHKTWTMMSREIDSLINRKGREPHDSHETLCAIIDKLGGPFEKLFTINFQNTVKCTKCNKSDIKTETNVYVACEPIINGNKNSSSLAAGIANTHAPKNVRSRECDHCKKTADGVMRCVPKTPSPTVLVVRTAQTRLWAEHTLGYCGSKYKLKSVIIYLHGCHYATLVFTGKQWILCDDDTIRNVSVTMIQGASEIIHPSSIIYEKM